jgi:hypothetical protein
MPTNPLKTSTFSSKSPTLFPMPSAFPLWN